MPTVAEQGYPGFDASIWFTLAGPTGMPAAMVQQLNADINQVLAVPEVAGKLTQYGAEDGGGSAAQLAAFMQAEQQRWAKLIREARITPDS